MQTSALVGQRPHMSSQDILPYPSQGTAFGKGKKLDQRSATSCSVVKQLEDPDLGLSFSTSPSSWVK